MSMNKALAAKVAAGAAALKQAQAEGKDPLAADPPPEGPRSAVGGVMLASRLMMADKQRIEELEGDNATLQGELAVLKARLADGSLHSAIPTDLIDDHPDQPRILVKDIEELAESIRAVGLMQPIVVRQGTDGRHILVAGSRRLAAFRKLNVAVIPALIEDPAALGELTEKGFTREGAAAVRALTENLARDDLSDFEIYLAFQRLFEQKIVNNQRQLARLVGYKENQVSMIMGFARLPAPALKVLAQKPEVLTYTHVKAVADLCDAGHVDLVVRGIKRLASGEIGSSAGLVDWLRKETRPAHIPTREESINTRSGKPAFRTRMEERQFVVTLPRGASPALLAAASERIEAVLKEVAEDAE